MINTFQSGWWEVDLLVNWSGDQGESRSSFIAKGAVGEFQISAYRKDEDVTDLDIEECATEHISAGDKLFPVQIGSFGGFSIHFGTEEEYWRQWWLRSGEFVIFATYDCAPVTEALKTSEPEHTQNSREFADTRRINDCTRPRPTRIFRSSRHLQWSANASVCRAVSPVPIINCAIYNVAMTRSEDPSPSCSPRDAGKALRAADWEPVGLHRIHG